MRFSTILCATDLSPRSERAVQVAYSLASAGAVVHLLYVAEPATVVSPLDGTFLSWPVDPADEAEAESVAERRLQRLVPEDVETAGVRTETSVVQGIGVASHVLAEAKRVHADVIVLGTHGRTGIGRILMGSVAAEVMKKSATPVVLVHDRPPLEPHEGRS